MTSIQIILIWLIAGFMMTILNLSFWHKIDCEIEQSPIFLLSHNRSRECLRYRKTKSIYVLCIILLFLLPYMALRNEEQPFVVTFTVNSEPNDSLSQFVFSWRLDRKKLSSENLQLFKYCYCTSTYEFGTVMWEATTKNDNF